MLVWCHDDNMMCDVLITNNSNDDDDDYSVSVVSNKIWYIVHDDDLCMMCVWYVLCRELTLSSFPLRYKL